jgi:tetratricopeptide (TPR) repeat protein
LKTERASLRVRFATALAAGLLIFAALWAYGGSFAAPFFFDDQPAIVDNPSIRQLSDLGRVLSPPANEGSSVAGRPLVNLSFAFNYAWGGLDVRGYHAVNLAIHVLAALTLFGITRRTLVRSFTSGSGQSGEGERGTHSAGGTDQVPTILAFLVALLWMLHPLLTESVTFVVQRTESLLGLFYLLTLYGFIRYADDESKGGTGWAAFSIAAGLLGMATKEVMVTAPVLVFLYDRTFVAGSFRGAWHRHGQYYAGLAATWLMLVYLVVHAGGSRAGAAGFGMGVSSWSYVLTQCRAVMLYLQLAVWPHPLVVDYGTDVARQLGEVAPQAAGSLLLLAGTAVALWRRPALGFLAAWFFAILAPSSSVVPLVTQTIAEHRMYLPLAAVIALAVCGGYQALVGLGPGRREVPTGVLRCYLAVLLALSAGLGILTARRNADYRSPLAIWSDTVAKRPGNARAHSDLGEALMSAGRIEEAIAQFEESLRLNPDYAETHNNLGSALSGRPGRANDAAAQFQAALRLKPNSAVVHFNLGNLWLNQPGRIDDAIGEYEAAIRLKPDYAAAHNNLGGALSSKPERLNDAIAEYQKVLRLKPDSPGAHFNLGNLWRNLPGRANDAIGEYRETLRLKPDFADAHLNLALALLDQPGGRDEARVQLEAVLRLQPANETARQILSGMRAQSPR